MKSKIIAFLGTCRFFLNIFVVWFSLLGFWQFFLAVRRVFECIISQLKTYFFCKVFGQHRQPENFGEIFFCIQQKRTMWSANEAVLIKECVEGLWPGTLQFEIFDDLTSIGTLSQKVNEHSTYIWFKVKCFVHSFAKTINTLLRAFCDAFRETSNYFPLKKRWNQSDLTFRNRVMIEVFGEK